MKEVTNRVVCDCFGCKNEAKYYFDAKNFNHKFNLCGDCVQRLSKEMSLILTPLSPTNKIKKVLDRKDNVFTNMEVKAIERK